MQAQLRLYSGIIKGKDLSFNWNVKASEDMQEVVYFAVPFVTQRIEGGDKGERRDRQRKKKKEKEANSHALLRGACKETTLLEPY